MNKELMMGKLRRIAKSWRSNTFLYSAENVEETTLLQQLQIENKITGGGFQWGNGDFKETITIR